MDNTNKHGKLERRKTRRPQCGTDNYRQLRNAEHGRNSLPQGGAYQLVIQYQIFIPENTQASYMIQAGQVAFMHSEIDMSFCVYLFACNYN